MECFRVPLALVGRDWPPALGPFLLGDRPGRAARRVRSRRCSRGSWTGPVSVRGAALTSVALVPGVPLPAAARAPAPPFGRIQGAGDRGASATAVGAAPPAPATAPTLE